MKKEITYEELQAAASYVQARLPYTPKVALVLGSGLGDFADRLTIDAKIQYGEIPHFPVSTVAGHAGCFLLGKVGDCPVLIMKGRVHYYEGYPISDVILPTRLMGLLGAKTLFLTNAAGGLNPMFNAGDFMLIADQISSFFPSPLIGENIDELGPRFPDMTDLYSARLRDVIKSCARSLDIPLREGVYMQLTGPAYETPTEVRMYRQLGADAVGMSTACEAIAARHMGLSICGISCITNMGAGMSGRPLSHEEVKEAGDKAAPLFKKLVTASIAAIARA